MKRCRFSLVSIFIFVAAIFAYPVNGTESRKLDESTTDPSVKCTPSCTQASPPPPPPPSPCPPPPALPPPTPPAPKKPPSTQYCPPPPPSNYIYITGPPGNLYPIDSDFSSGATATTKFSRRFQVFVGFAIMGFLASW